MNYQIQITKTEPNPNFVEEMKKWQEENRNGYSRNSIEMQPKSDFVKNVLLVELTAEQFESMKAEILKVFK